MRVAFKLEDDQISRSLATLGPDAFAAAKRSLGDSMKALVPRVKSVTPVEPEDGGALRDSVRATKATATKAGRVSCGVIAGGDPLKGKVQAEGHKANVYAMVQHEDLTLHHQTGEAKFVERPFIAAVPAAIEAARTAIDGVAKAAGA